MNMNVYVMIPYYHFMMYNVANVVLPAITDISIHVGIPLRYQNNYRRPMEACKPHFMSEN